MTDKQLISKLNSLRSVNPEANWLENNRELLLTQLSNSGATKISSGSAFLINIQSFMRTSLQPASALAVFVFILVSGSLFSHQLFNKTQPNDSLYIARIISEKAKLNTIFNQEDRDKMAVQFASNHAQDITNILADPEFNHADEVTVARLSKDFKKEINVVKTRMTRLTPTPVVVTEPEETMVLIANNEKDDAGLEIYENPEVVVTEGEVTNGDEKEIINEKVVGEEVAEDMATTTSQEISPDKILEEAEKSFENKDYDDALNKLKEVGNIIK